MSWFKPNLEIIYQIPEDKVIIEKDENKIEIFRAGTIQEINQKDNKVQIKDNQNSQTLWISNECIYQKTEAIDAEQTTEDMVELENLNEVSLIDNCCKRFMQDKIFTYVGPTLIALNPFKQIDAQKDTNLIQKYQTMSSDQRFDIRSMEPNIYGLSALAINQLVMNQRNQSIVISGESGAGKTEQTKMSMKFITSLTNNNSKQRMSINKRFSRFRTSINQFIFDSGTESLENRILSCSPILEAFGNSKTVRNDNSSRFGKLVLLLFNKSTNSLKGAIITNYLLEKARVVDFNEPERNYHIFYHLVRGSPECLTDRLGISRDVSQYVYLKKGKHSDLKSMPDSEMFIEIQDSFKKMNVDQDIQDTIWNIIASILLIGQLSFDDKQFQQSDQKQSCRVNGPIGQIEQLLNIQEGKLVYALVNRRIVVMGKKIDSCDNLQSIENNKSSLAKDLYNRVFNFLVKVLNRNITGNDIDIDETIKNKERYSIGLLDIFGFEFFTINGFEQFFINFANEKLQQLYISYIFKQDINLFIGQGLKDYLFELKFSDNQTVLDLMEKPPIGMFHLLDASSQFSNQDDNDLLQTMFSKQKKISDKIEFTKSVRDKFTIIHSPKSVEYTIKGFRDKNQDNFPYLLETVINESSNLVLKMIFNNTLERDDIDEVIKQNESQKSRTKYLGAKFRMDMNSLMEELQSTDCHFTRCIKSNDAKSKDTYNQFKVLQQLRSLGVLETVKIRQGTFPIRYNYQKFYSKYYQLDRTNKNQKLQQILDHNPDFKKLSQDLVQQNLLNVGTDQMLLGNSIIFLKQSVINTLDEKMQQMMKAKNNAASTIQNNFLIFIMRYKLRSLHKALIIIQQKFRTQKEYRKFMKLRKGVRKIQKQFRLHQLRTNFKHQLQTLKNQQQAINRVIGFFKSIILRKQFKQTKLKIIKIQTLARQFMAKKKLKKMKAIDLISQKYKGYKQYKKFKEDKQKYLKVQSAIHKYIYKKRAKRQMKSMKQEKNSAMLIQSLFRMYKQKKEYQKLLKIVKIQSIYRMIQKRRDYEQIKQQIVKIQYNFRRYRIMNKLQNMKIGRMSSEYVFYRTWLKIKERWYDDACIHIQKVYRGMRCRKQNRNKILQIKKVRQEFILQKVCTQLQKVIRGFLVRNRIRNGNRAASKLQRYCRTRWTKLILKQVVKSVRMIQNMYIRWSIRKQILTERWAEFQITHINPHNENINSDFQQLFGIYEQNMEWNNIEDEIFYRQGNVLKTQSDDVEFSMNSDVFNFNNLCNEDSNQFFMNKTGLQHKDLVNEYVQNDLVEENSEQVFQSLLETPQKQNLQQSNQIFNDRIKLKSPQKPVEIEEKQLLRNAEKDKSRKIKLFNTIMSLEYNCKLVDEVYEQQQWINNYYQFQQHEDNFQIEVGETFTTFVSQDKKYNAYSFGNNSYGQLVADQNMFQDIHQMQTDNKNKFIRSVNNENHGFLLDNVGQVYGFGDNTGGQLGLNHNQRVEGMHLNTYLQDIQDIGSKGSHNVAINRKGKVYMWPFQREKNKYLFKPIELPVSVPIGQIACGWNFTVLLAKNGQMFTFGKGSKKGQLGQPDLKPRYSPTGIQLSEKVEQISCGYSHTVVRSSRGKIYGWGDNSLLQISYRTKSQYIQKPIEVQIVQSSYLKVFQVQAGLNSNISLLSNGKVYIWGHTKMMGSLKQPQLMKVFSNQDDYIVIQVQATWSRSMSVLYAIVADTRQVQENKNIISKVCANLSQQWISSSVEPPILDSFMKYFSITSMKRQVVDYKQKQNKQNRLNVHLTHEQTDFLIQKFGIQQDKKNNNTTQSQLNKQKVNNTQLSKEVELRKIKGLALNLLNTPKEKWNQFDIQLMNVIQDPIVCQLLKKL